MTKKTRSWLGIFTPPESLQEALRDWDRTVFRRIANRNSPVGDAVLPVLSRVADNAVLWMGVSAGLWATGKHTAQRAGRRGIITLAVTSVLVNAFTKRALPRVRPPEGLVPEQRKSLRRPTSSSFPSGHSASAAAYATAASHAYPQLRLPLTALAASVGYSRVFTGVHYPSDVLAGAAIGAGVGLVSSRIAPLRTPDPVRDVEAIAVPQPARADGEGIVMVVNPKSGGGNAGNVVKELARELPAMEIMKFEGEDLVTVLRTAARKGQVLGMCGGDGSVSAAARVAVETGVPLLVAPGGTFNHFAGDLGIGTVADVVRAAREGAAIRADVGVIRDLPDVAGNGKADGEIRQVFVNTASLGSYPSFVAVREKYEPKLGKNLAAAVAMWQVLRKEEPLRMVINGRERKVAMIFIGNNRYQPRGFVPTWRPRLDDGLLDLRVVETGRWFPGLRLIISLLTGRLGSSSLYTEVGSAGLDVHLPDGPGLLAWDGEIGPGTANMRFEVERLCLTVYRPNAS